MTTSPRRNEPRRPGRLGRWVLATAMGVLGLGAPTAWWLAGRPRWWAGATAAAVAAAAAVLTGCVIVSLARRRGVARPAQLCAALSVFRFAVALAVTFAGHLVLALEVLGLMIWFLAAYLVLGVQLAWLVGVAARRRSLDVVMDA